MNVKKFVDTQKLVESGLYLLSRRHLTLLGEQVTFDDQNVMFYAWPEMFASTTGPFGGIGGHAMITMQMYHVHLPMVGSVVYCNGRLLGVLHRHDPALTQFELVYDQLRLGRTPRDFDWSAFREATAWEKMEREQREILNVARDLIKKGQS